MGAENERDRQRVGERWKRATTTGNYKSRARRGLLRYLAVEATKLQSTLQGGKRKGEFKKDTKEFTATAANYDRRQLDKRGEPAVGGLKVLPLVVIPFVRRLRRG